MKNILLIILSIFSFNLFAQNINIDKSGKSILLKNLRINFQANVAQSMTASDSTGNHDYYLGNSFSAGIEWGFNYNDNIDYGIGIEYQFQSSVAGYDGKIGSVPIYTFVDYPLLERKQFPVNLTIRLGYAFLTNGNNIEKVGDGLYHSLGVSTTFSENFQIKLLYSNEYGKIKLFRNEYSIRRSNFSLGIYFLM